MIAAIVTCGQFLKRVMISRAVPPSSHLRLRRQLSLRSYRSSPEQNESPAPVVTIQRILSFSLNSFRQSIIFAIKALLRAFFLSGRLRVSQAMPFSSETRLISAEVSLITISLFLIATASIVYLNFRTMEKSKVF